MDEIFNIKNEYYDKYSKLLIEHMSDYEEA